MYNINVIHMPDDWGWSFDLPFLSKWSKYGFDLTDLIERFDAGKLRYVDRLTTYHILREMRLDMGRTKKPDGTTTGNGSNSGVGKGGGVKWQWANCRLSDDDIAVLGRSDATLEYVAACLAVLGDDGYGVTIKSVDKGKSRCVTLYRPDFPRTGFTVGVSSFGNNVRDAGLAVLYKLDNYGGGDFTAFDVEGDSDSERPRFR
jgi:hypothetical protein